MATITKLSSGKWKAIIRIAGRSKTKTFQLKSAAKAWAANAEKDQELAITLGSPGAALTRVAQCAVKGAFSQRARFPPGNYRSSR